MKEILKEQIHTLCDYIAEATEHDLSGDHIRSLAKMTEAEMLICEFEETLSMLIIPVSQVRYIMTIKKKMDEIKKIMFFITNSLIDEI